MNAFEVKRISDVARYKNSEDIVSDVLSTVEGTAKEGLYSDFFSYSLPLNFDYKKVVHHLKDEGYQVSIKFLPYTFVLKVMWD